MTQPIIKDTLLNETLEALAEAGQSVEDIAWIGLKDGTASMDWESYSLLADTPVERGTALYSKQVHEDLVIVFEDGSWLQ